jgi:hypothetical protein
MGEFSLIIILIANDNPHIMIIPSEKISPLKIISFFCQKIKNTTKPKNLTTARVVRKSVTE